MNVFFHACYVAGTVLDIEYPCMGMGMGRRQYEGLYTIDFIFIGLAKSFLQFFGFILFFIFYLFFYCVGSSLLHAGFSLVAASRGYSPLRCAGFSLWWFLLLQSTGSMQAGFSSCGTWVQ